VESRISYFRYSRILALNEASDDVPTGNVPDFFGGRLELVDAAAVDDDVRSFTSECCCRGLSEATERCCDERYVILGFEVRLRLNPAWAPIMGVSVVQRAPGSAFRISIYFIRHYDESAINEC